MIWQFINTGFRRGKFNMEYDEFLAKRLITKHGKPSVRVYGWNPPAISLGYNQKIEDIDIEKCRTEGIDIVRRPTGGRAILHWNELTYSVVMYSKDMSISEVYQKISNALVVGLKLLGVEVELEKSQPNFQQIYKTKTAIPCFSSSARYEIQYNGKKLVGSAQRRYTSGDGNEVVLQHGSILIGPEHRWLTDFLSDMKVETLRDIRRTLEEHTTDLKQILNREVEFDEVAEAIKLGFEKSWNIKFIINDKKKEKSLL